MIKHTLLAALTLVLFAAVAQAQLPDLPLDPATPAPLADVTAPDVTPIAPTPVVDDAVIMHDSVPHDMHTGDLSGHMAGCGCQQSTGCNSCAPTMHRSTWKERCAYYRSVRQAFDRGPCCAEYFGGFGPLWESYCSDKQRCFTSGHAAACSPRPFQGLRHRRVRSSCDACGMTTNSCDCVGTEMSMPADGQIDIGQPPQPTEADASEPTPPQLDGPVDTKSAASANNKSWLNRNRIWRTNR